MKMREVLRVLRIGIIRLLAPEVSGSISAVDIWMAEMDSNQRKRRRSVRCAFVGVLNI
jgi:hypothetical protein